MVMKTILILLSLIISIRVHAASCHSSPSVSYSGNAGISSLSNFKKTAKKYFDKIAKDYFNAKNCSIYASIHKDLRSLHNKSKKYFSDSKKGGLANRKKRGKAARCLKSIYSKMISLGKKAVEFEAQTADAGTNQDYQVTTLFAFDQYCDAPNTIKNTPAKNTPAKNTPNGNNTITLYPKCPKSTRLSPENKGKWNKNTLNAKFYRFDPKTKSCYYKINNKGPYKLYTLKPNAKRPMRRSTSRKSTRKTSRR